MLRPRTWRGQVVGVAFRDPLNPQTLKPLNSKPLWGVWGLGPWDPESYCGMDTFSLALGPLSFRNS